MKIMPVSMPKDIDKYISLYGMEIPSSVKKHKIILNFEWIVLVQYLLVRACLSCCGDLNFLLIFVI